MAIYEFRCETTKQEFEIWFPSLEKAKKAVNEKTVLCPCCKKNKVIKIFSSKIGFIGLPTTKG
jgi:hypothetical protein